MKSVIVVALMIVLSGMAFASGMKDPENLVCRQGNPVTPYQFDELAAAVDRALEQQEEVHVCVSYTAPAGLLDDTLKTTVEVRFARPGAVTQQEKEAEEKGYLLLEGFVTMFTEAKAPLGKWGLSRRHPVQSSALPLKELELNNVISVVSYVASALLGSDWLNVEYAIAGESTS